ncbi:hypothetical protein WJX75_007749 [Coccomyxa subellipsoidea]|uniref:Uncharacterized protein n=1 Tax=Coccomyxa subellipsoidea TaxID=248742 RepID=A0ABR2Z1A6_9CHLO
MTCKASDEYNEDNALWQQRKQLESLIKLSDTAELGDPEPIGASQTIQNLPLWRIQTAVLPGAQEVLHVHVPHYTHMIRVKKARQALPYSRADVEVWPDEEEVACQRNAAMLAVDACQSSADLDMSAAMQTVETAAVAAAIACSQVWHEYELAPLRALVKDEDLSNAVPGEGVRSKEGMFAPPKLLWRSVLASLQGLTVAQGGPPVGQDSFVLLTHQCEDHNSHWEVDQLLKDFTDRAAETALLAAELLAHRSLLGENDDGGPVGLLQDAPRTMNTTCERGIRSRGISQATNTEVEAAQRSDRAISTGPSSEIEEENFDYAEGRQAILEARTAAARLKLILEVLLEQRNRLQALAALRTAGEG